MKCFVCDRDGNLRKYEDDLPGIGLIELYWCGHCFFVTTLDGRHIAPVGDPIWRGNNFAGWTEYRIGNPITDEDKTRRFYLEGRHIWKEQEKEQ
jgi:hypothetical protein